ncbi:MarR family transcriptional regulator [Nocardia huaxiensis]|uniref:MarR family transcriptional regulator n=1 Tax=Nocardia huaxiensis TaxID=2755382 RepID=A0A7D6Z4S2_9NOCA|nr:MarR family transcriptional regulator [Nocardia huaxiensis]QLY31204.1 MarR family transcriptional regulator [Nocardia huaxiensis]UFS94734.1 MarR family transcriptional regulator [Nocardia huaxiensis]
MPKPTTSVEQPTDPRTGAPGLVAEWRDLLARHATTSCALEKELQGRHHIGLSEFETLDRLIDAGCESYKMSDLANDIYLSQSALSRAVARLERDGLVSRTLCTEDRRAIFVCLTDKGREVYEQAAPTHRAVLEQSLG